MRAVVLGGAGYIGSVTAQLLKESGHEVIVIDDMSTGHKSFIHNFDQIILNIIKDKETFVSKLKHIKPDIVLHFAAKISVAESVKDPMLYFLNNTYGTMSVLDAITKAGCSNIVFSSTAAVYGEPKRIPIREDDNKEPINPYGVSKHLSEQLIRSFSDSNGSNWVSFRYFNAAGAYKNSAMDYPIMTHLIPHATEAVLGKQKLNIFGDDYPTKDGSCIRDFVHVLDIARAHVIAAEKMMAGKKLQTAINLGSGSGYSVFEVIKTVEKVAGKAVPHAIAARRPGDPAVLVAKCSRAKSLLRWEPELSLEDMVTSHFRWRKSNNNY